MSWASPPARPRTRSRRRTGSSPASCTRTPTPATPRPRPASSRCPRPTGCSRTRRSARSTTRPAPCSPAAAVRRLPAAAGSRAARSAPARGGQTFDMGDLFGNTGGAGPAAWATCSAGSSAARRAAAARGRGDHAGSAARTSRASCGSTSRRRPRRRGADPAVGAPAAARRCGGTGARPGTAPRSCPTCAGVGLVSRSQGAFAFSEPCRDCRGTGRIIDDPCPECGGDGVSTRTRSLTVRVPAGVDDGSRVRLKGQGEPGSGGAPAGDLYVNVHVTPHRVFGRSEKNADDLDAHGAGDVPGAGAGLHDHRADVGRHGALRIPAGTRAGARSGSAGAGCRRTARRATCSSRWRWRCPQRLADAAQRRLQSYAEATKGVDPRADLLGGRRGDISDDTAVPAACRRGESGQPDVRHLGGRRAGRAARPDAAQLRPAGARTAPAGRPAAGGATPPATSPCSARCSGCRRRRASTSPASSGSSSWSSWSTSCRAGSRSCLAELRAVRAAAEQAAAMVHRSYRRDLVPVDRRHHLVVWHPERPE